MKLIHTIMAAVLLLASTVAWAESADRLRFKDMAGADASLAEGQPMLVAFWRSDCAPCLQEMKILPDIASQNPGLSITLISLHDAEHTRAHLASMPSNVLVLVAQDEGKTVLADFGNDRMLALPYSIMRDKKGGICDRHYGILLPDRVKEWRKQC